MLQCLPWNVNLFAETLWCYLPVSAVVDELLAALQSAAQVMLHAPTGAGKSTWLPLEILRSGGLPGRVVMLKPRRLAAKNVALRLAEQLGECPGQTIGYRMRNESRCGPATRLEVVTEGILTRQLQQDSALDGISLVILDEFHERNLQGEIWRCRWISPACFSRTTAMQWDEDKGSLRVGIARTVRATGAAGATAGQAVRCGDGAGNA